MPLIHYSQYIYFPGGGPAVNYSVEVTLRGGNVAVPLFSDKAGTIPLSNPTLTDNEALLSFYAPPGDYIVWLAGEEIPIPVDDTESDEAWPGTFVHEQETPSASWQISHRFGVRPSVTVLVSDQEVAPDVSHQSDESLTLTFGTPTGGVAYLRR